MREKMGFFGGTFDPIHFGHLNLAIELLEKGHLDRILFCPAHLSPTKQEEPPEASPKHRLNMVTLATEEMPFFVPYDQELSRPPPSFTIDTVRDLVKKERDLYLILGEDMLYTLDQWKEAEELLALATPLIGTRFGFDQKKIDLLPPFVKRALEKGICHTATMEVSSTRVRERLKKRLYCSHLIPGKILDYIYQNSLYCNS